MSEDDSKFAEAWAYARMARSDGAATTPRREQYLAEVSAAMIIISAFVKSLKEGEDPWGTIGDGMHQLMGTDSRQVADLVVSGLKRRGFSRVDVRDELESYYALALDVPVGLTRWKILVQDPILAVSP